MVIVVGAFAAAASTVSAITSIDVGKTVALRHQTRTRGCTLGPLPDRRCSPGAYSSKLTKRVLCSSSFRTGPIRNVPLAVKHQVEEAYGLKPRSYGSTLEIDHIISLELGGSNDPRNLYPERATFADGAPGFHVKDKLENVVHRAVCGGSISLRAAQRQIAGNWELLYQQVMGVEPQG
ncbi:MAG: HNH endonuclease signature motif containing protein [Gaiellaceae bacterium]